MSRLDGEITGTTAILGSIGSEGGRKSTGSEPSPARRDWEYEIDDQYDLQRLQYIQGIRDKPADHHYLAAAREMKGEAGPFNIGDERDNDNTFPFIQSISPTVGPLSAGDRLPLAGQGTVKFRGAWVLVDSFDVVAGEWGA